MKRPGDLMRKRREELGLSLQELESSSNIPRRNLEALEGDQYDHFAAESYYYGFLRNYAESLKLDPQILINAYQNVKIIESPLPLEQLTGNQRGSRLSPLLLCLFLLVLLAAAGTSYYFWRHNSKSETKGNTTGTQAATKLQTEGQVPQQVTQSSGKIVLINRYPWMQDLQNGLILRLVLIPGDDESLQPELLVQQDGQDFQLKSLNLDQDYELTLASGKTNSLPLRSDSVTAKDGTFIPSGSFRLDFTRQDGEPPAVLINLNSNNNREQDKAPSQSDGGFGQKQIKAKFQAFAERHQSSVSHAILQAVQPTLLQLQLSFQRDSYIRYQWSGEDAQEFPVLKNKVLLLHGEAPLTLWLSNVSGTKIKINGQDLKPKAFQDVFIGRLEWQREASLARLYLTPGP